MLVNGSTATVGLTTAAGGPAAVRRRPVFRPLGKDPVDPHRAGDVLQRLLAQILEGDVEPAVDLIVHGGGDAYAADLSELLDARGDVHAIAIDVAVLEDDV